MCTWTGAGSPPGLLPFLRKPEASEPILTTLEPAPAAWEGKRSPFAKTGCPTTDPTGQDRPGQGSAPSLEG